MHVLDHQHERVLGNRLVGPTQSIAETVARCEGVQAAGHVEPERDAENRAITESIHNDRGVGVVGQAQLRLKDLAHGPVG